MTLHELAGLLEHLRDGLGGALGKTAATEFTEAAEAFRSMPDKKLKDHVADVKKMGAGDGAGGAEKLAARIRACKTKDSPEGKAILKEIKALKKPGLADLFAAFGKPVGKLGVPDLKKAAEDLIGMAPANDPPFAPTLNEQDAELVQFVALYRRLQSDATLSIEQIRQEFAPFRELPKRALERIAAEIGYDFRGNQDEIANELLEKLERLKLSRVNGEVIRELTQPAGSPN